MPADGEVFTASFQRRNEERGTRAGTARVAARPSFRVPRSAFEELRPSERHGHPDPRPAARRTLDERGEGGAAMGDALRVRAPRRAWRVDRAPHPGAHAERAEA